MSFLSAASLTERLSKLRNDKRLVILAAAQAQRAADYILGTARKGGKRRLTENSTNGRILS